MKPKNFVSIVLLLFVAASVAYLVVGGSHSRSEPNKASPVRTAAPAPIKPPDAQTADALRESTKTPKESVTPPREPAKPQSKVVAYYFHRTQRCRTCLAMEAYAKDALIDEFSDALASGALEWRVHNVEDSGNGHFVQDYGLTASALVMVRLEDDDTKEWKNLDQVWSLVRDEGEFKAYVQREARNYLDGGS